MAGSNLVVEIICGYANLPIRVLQIANREIGVYRIGSGPLPAFRFSVLQTFQEFGEVFLPDRSLKKSVMAA